MMMRRSLDETSSEDDDMTRAVILGVSWSTFCGDILLRRPLMD
jgi:hypothetical protein